MSLSAEEIRLVVAAIARDATGAELRGVLTPLAPDRLVLDLRSPGASHLVQIVASAGSSRIGRLRERPEKAKRPHPFAALVRREAAGLSLAGIEQIGGDRAVILCFSSAKRSGSLIAELTGRHSNLFWLGRDGAIAGSLRPNLSHKRRLVPGRPYEPLAARAGPAAPSRFEDGPDLEDRVEAFYREVESSREEDLARAGAARLVRRAARRLDRLVERLEEDRRRSDLADRLRLEGHVLKASLGRARRGMESLEAFDFEGRPIEIPLDPALSPSANMERLFDRARRMARAAPRVKQRLERARLDRDRVGALLEEIPAAGPDRLEEIRAEAIGRYPDLEAAEARRSAPPERLPYMEFAVAGGRIARVGRSASDNDALTLRHSHKDDLWLHARGRRGSHVVVPLGRGEDPTPELLVDAAHLAAHFSQARGDADVEVAYTRRRYVQKPRGAPAGSVRLLREKTLSLRVDPDRISRLLGRDQ